MLKVVLVGATKAPGPVLEAGMVRGSGHLAGCQYAALIKARVLQLVAQLYEPGVADPSAPRTRFVLPKPAHGGQTQALQAAPHQVPQQNRLIVDHIHQTGPFSIESCFQGTGGIRHMQPVAVGRSAARAFQSGCLLYTSPSPRDRG